jgi:hypothetical protein
LGFRGLDFFADPDKEDHDCEEADAEQDVEDVGHSGVVGLMGMMRIMGAMGLTDLFLGFGFPINGFPD